MSENLWVELIGLTATICGHHCIGVDRDLAALTWQLPTFIARIEHHVLATDTSFLHHISTLEVMVHRLVHPFRYTIVCICLLKDHSYALFELL